jgi:hypothetical protein
MWSNMVIVDALTVQDRGIGVLQGSHDFRSFLECSMIAFHTIVVQATLQANSCNMNRIRELKSEAPPSS